MQPEKEPQVLRNILSVEYTLQEGNSPSLLVTAVGRVNTGGFSEVRLIRVDHKEPPKDGVQEYRLVAIPPSGPAAQVISQVTASDTWNHYTTTAPWLAGIRVYGAGDGIMEKRFGKK